MRTWKVRMTSYWPLLMALYLTGLGLGESPLVILSLCSLALSYVLGIFSFLYLYTLSFPFLVFSLPYVFLHKVVFLNICLHYLSKKIKDHYAHPFPALFDVIRITAQVNSNTYTLTNIFLAIRK